ncbi:ATP-binding cassette domain-containing protein [Spelaeicoccus albus]
MAHVEYFLPDGRKLLGGAEFKVPEGSKTALIGPNGTGKTTLLRIIAGELAAHAGGIQCTGTRAVMPQFIGHVGADKTVRDLLIDVAPTAIRTAAEAVDEAELRMMDRDDEPTQMAYATALADWADVAGYEYEAVWDEVTMAAIGVEYARARWREASTLSGGEQKRLVLEALLRSPADTLLLDEPDNYLDVPGKRWLEDKLWTSSKTVLFISHDRELLANAATRIVTLEPGGSGAIAWVHGGGFASYDEARARRIERLDELRKRWDEEYAKLKALVLMYKQKAAYNSDMAARYQAARTRFDKFALAGPPEAVPYRQHVTMRLTGSRTGKRAVVCTRLELTGLMDPFDVEIRYGDRVSVLGANGSGKSHFLRLLAGGGTEPQAENKPVDELRVTPVAHSGVARLGARVRPGLFAQTHVRPDLAGRTLLDILHRGDSHRAGLPRENASRVLDRYGLARAAEQTFDSLSGGQQARLQILMLELSGATLLLLDEPTDNLDLDSAEALEQGIEGFDGTVVAVTHDRWFARGFDRHLVFGADGDVYESSDPVWDDNRVRRSR